MADSAPEAGTITMVRPNAKLSKDDMFLMKLSQIVMMGIGFLSIWYGVFAVAFDEESTALPAERMRARNIPWGRWKKCLGKGKRRAYLKCCVFMNIAAFKISYSAP